ncbi:MAG TPA: GGDEF domain-containing protein, partial [Candidatus Deferrimicrobium sp.]|nr:GGDEF domain-containing protein [Candidatus Deferrimicrobium sp.]
LWPVLGRVGNLLFRRGYSVEMAGSWSALLADPGRREGLAAVLLGEYGSVAEEEEILRRFRDGGGPGVPVFLIGGQSAVRRTRRFREAGADMVFAADLSEEEVLDRAQPLLAYGEMYRNAVLAGREFSDLAMRDGLTGLPDRRRFSLDLDRCAETARRIGRPLSCIVTDIDDLRRVNETYGSEVGDGVIRQFGNVLARAKRSYDTVARLGGDEFVWLLLGVGRDEAMRAAERAQRLVSGSVFNGTHEPVRVTATFGVASLSPGGEWNARTLVENADRALYWGKESGKNRIRFYPPGKEVA